MTENNLRIRSLLLTLTVSLTLTLTLTLTLGEMTENHLRIRPLAAGDCASRQSGGASMGKEEGLLELLYSKVDTGVHV